MRVTAMPLTCHWSYTGAQKCHRVSCGGYWPVAANLHALHFKTTIHGAASRNTPINIAQTVHARKIL